MNKKHRKQYIHALAADKLPLTDAIRGNVPLMRAIAHRRVELAAIQEKKDEMARKEREAESQMPAHLEHG